jgi:hypothetical protein
MNFFLKYDDFRKGDWVLQATWGKENNKDFND